MRYRFKRKPGNENGESFVWITFSDLLTSLFLVFMVIAFWGISDHDKNRSHIDDLVKAGKKCLDEKKEIDQTNIKNRQILTALSKTMFTSFQELQSRGLCRSAKMQETGSTGGFRIFEEKEKSSWFEDGKASLSKNAEACLREIGKVWVKKINESSDITNNLASIMIEGHTNSKPFNGFGEKKNFVWNLKLSQERALIATAFLINVIEEKVKKQDRLVELRELMVALGKSSLEPVKENGVEDFDRSKRLEFKVILRGFESGT